MKKTYFEIERELREANEDYIKAEYRYKFYLETRGKNDKITIICRGIYNSAKKRYDKAYGVMRAIVDF